MSRPKVLVDLVAAVEGFLDAFDREMKLPSTPERGKRLALLANALDMAKDRARFAQDGLDIDYRTGKKRLSKPSPGSTSSSSAEGSDRGGRG